MFLPRGGLTRDSQRACPPKPPHFPEGGMETLVKEGLPRSQGWYDPQPDLECSLFLISKPVLPLSF